ncbi:MAG: TrmJ/YjtD family RNA methyltransferase [Oscillochloris sp.]|nr:TrmJ/YjtD family RNA methyltransferase [Oscillochloris sp.]
MNQLVVVLLRPRDVRNIGAVVRAMKNTGVGQLRLVQPEHFDPADIGGIAHRSDDILAGMTIHASLDEALADCRFVLGTSARSHRDRPLHTDPRILAPDLLARAQAGPLALLFGPEDNGLDNDALDRCQALLRLPTDPHYPSLNLAQAVLLVLYELRQAAVTPAPAPIGPAPASGAELETCFAALEDALGALRFVKSGTATTTMRIVRRLILRAAPSSREVAVITAIAREVAKGRREG